mmetsp:Transcript_3610/g.4836  ORF Transcript_3610/g.4836 Transcript_3610/m.4836 type:complete len:90 (+) Transcript_3610:354-623(+)
MLPPEESLLVRRIFREEEKIMEEEDEEEEEDEDEDEGTGGNARKNLRLRHLCHLCLQRRFAWSSTRWIHEENGKDQMEMKITFQDREGT